MTISGDGGLPVKGPECRPSRFGLRSVADVTEKSGDEWARGGEWDELACNVELGVTGVPCPPLPEQHSKTTERGFNTRISDPFAIYAGWKCNSISLADAWDNAEELLTRNWWRALELTLWTGLDQDGQRVRSTFGDVEDPDESDSPFLWEDLTPAEGALDITSGIAALESYAGDCSDCEPIIHGNKGLATYVAERGLIELDGDRHRLKGTGSLFVPGAGYPSGSPGSLDPAPDDEAWMVVSGGINITHGPTFFTPDKDDAAAAVDRLLNDVVVFAERLVMLQVGCCIGAVRVRLDSCCGGGIESL